MPFSTKYNALYDLKDVASLVLLYTCARTAMIANKAVADLSSHAFKDDKNICIPTAQWLLGMISAIDPDKMGGPVQTHVREHDQGGIRS